MDGINIRVTPGELKTISSDTLSKIKKAKSTFEQISGVVSKMRGYWEGDGQVKAEEYYNIRKDDYERIFDALSAHVTNLQTIAGVYEMTESSNVGQSESLPIDVIF